MHSIIDLFESCVSKYANNTYLLEKSNGKYSSLTYQQVKDKVYAFGAGLLALGANTGERMALLAEGCNNWVISELGMLYNGVINVPLSVKLNAQEIKFRLEHSGATTLFTTSRQYEKIKDIRGQIKSLNKIVFIDDQGDKTSHDMYFSEITKQGENILMSGDTAFTEKLKTIQASHEANICYTSGTTAEPKGIVLTHRNYTANVEQSIDIVNVQEGSTTLLILPWDHAFAHTCGIYAVMASGAAIASVETGKTPMETLKNIPKNIKEVQPDFLLSVPALAKNFRKSIEKNIKEKGAFTEKFFNHALKVAYTYNGLGYNKGKGFRIMLKPLVTLYNRVLFSKIRDGFGGKLSFFVGGGALLDIELQRFFYAVGMPMFQGYGLSEAAPVISANSFAHHKLSSSGKIVNQLEVKICDEDNNTLPHGEKGEIVVKGENVMKEYWKNPDASNETLKNGWLYTGDLGYFDKHGFLYVLGRFKSLLIADDGEKFSPEGIEEAMCENSKYIDQCMLYNNQCPYTIALVYPNKEALKNYVTQKGITINTQEGAELALQKIEKEIGKYRKHGDFSEQFPHRWLPAAVGVLNEPFTEQNNMINSTMKMVRPKITEIYSGLIEYLYKADAKKIDNPANVEAVYKLFNK